MKRHGRMVKWIILVGTLLSTVFFLNLTPLESDDEYYKIDRGLFYLKEVFETVSRSYVDHVDPETLSRSAINGMLKEFDPYTVFFEDPGSHQMRMITRGKYGGVGMEIGVQNSRITVIAPMENTPAWRAGIRAGDEVVSIEGKSTEGFSLDETSQKLRGKVGSKVSLKIRRPGIPDPIPYDLIREEILLKDVSYAAFILPEVAYIRLAGFSDKAGDELREALRDLQSQQHISGVILDLRDNPGGLLTSAVEVANVFLPPGQLVVSTRGTHESENKFYTKRRPLLATEPLVVLVNEASASASEIVAGAIQDLDRGVLIGADTFGKGLVQKVFPIDRVSQTYLKITTAKYYIPSGRSIQKEDYKSNSRMFTDHSDSSEYNPAINFYTQNGRIVHGGGGVNPDIQVASDTLDGYLEAITARGFLFRFAVEYLTRHPESKNANHLMVDENIMAEFENFVVKEKLEVPMDGEEELRRFLSIAEDKKYDQDVRDLVTVSLQKLAYRKTRQFSDHRAQIRQLLEAEFAEKLTGSTARIRTLLNYDGQVKQALKVLENQPKYEQILAVDR